MSFYSWIMYLSETGVDSLVNRLLYIICYWLVYDIVLDSLGLELVGVLLEGVLLEVEFVRLLA
jgi:hypothetical protein